MRHWVPEMELPSKDDKERVCKGCGEKIIPARISAGYPGSGRHVIGGWYGLPADKELNLPRDSGPYCPSCAQIEMSERKEKRRLIRD